MLPPPRGNEPEEDAGESEGDDDYYELQPSIIVGQRGMYSGGIHRAILCLNPRTLAVRFRLQPEFRPCALTKVTDETFAASHLDCPYEVTIHSLRTRKVVVDVKCSEPVEDVWSSVYALETIRADSRSEAPRLATGDLMGNARLWNCEDGDLIQTFPDIPGEVHVIRVVHEWNDELFISGEDDETNSPIRCFDVRKNIVTNKFTAHELTVRDIQADLETGVFFSVSVDKTAKIWSRRSRQGSNCVASLPLASAGVASFYAADLRSLFVALFNGIVEVWDPRNVSRRVSHFSVRKAEASPRVMYSGIVRVHPTQFVSTGRDIISWKPSGKILGLASHEAADYYFGLSTIGLEYDSPPFGVIDENSSRDLAERFAALPSLKRFDARVRTLKKSMGCFRVLVL